MDNEEFFPKDYNLEDVFDTMILPMLKTIVNICDEHQIPMVASFQFSVDGDDTKLCTSVVATEDRVSDRLAYAAKVLTETD